MSNKGCKYLENQLNLAERENTQLKHENNRLIEERAKYQGQVMYIATMSLKLALQRFFTLRKIYKKNEKNIDATALNDLLKGTGANGARKVYNYIRGFFCDRKSLGKCFSGRPFASLSNVFKHKRK